MHTNVQPFVYSQGIKKYQIPPGPGSLPFPSADPLMACLRLRSEAPRWSCRPGPPLCSGAVSSLPPDPRCDLRLLDLEPCERLASGAAPALGLPGSSPPSGSSLQPSLLSLLSAWGGGGGSPLPETSIVSVLVSLSLSSRTALLLNSRPTWAAGGAPGPCSGAQWASQDTRPLPPRPAPRTCHLGWGEPVVPSYTLPPGGPHSPHHNLSSHTPTRQQVCSRQLQKMPETNHLQAVRMNHCTDPRGIL